MASLGRGARMAATLHPRTFTMSSRLPDTPHSLSPDTLADRLEVTPAKGLTASEAARRLAVFGPNHLRSLRPRSLVAMLLHQFRSVVVYLLAGAALLAFALGDIPEALAIGV